MRTVTTLKNQTIYDIAVQCYGNVMAVGELLSLNPDLRNDRDGQDIDDSLFYLDVPMAPGTIITYNDDSEMMSKSIVKEINQPVITYQLWPVQ